MYQSFRGGSNAQVPSVETEVKITRMCSVVMGERMRLTNYCEREATREFIRVPFQLSFFTDIHAALYTGRLARSANSRQFGINGQNRRGREGRRGRAIDLYKRLLYLY